MVRAQQVVSQLLLGALLCIGCGPERADKQDPSSDAGQAEPPPFTPETLGGTLLTPGNPRLTWARAFPGDLTLPPEVRLGPDAELIAEVSIERRRKDQMRYDSDLWLMRFDATTGDVVWMQQLDTWPLLELDSQGNIILAWPTRVDKLDPAGHTLWSKSLKSVNAKPRSAISVDGNDNILCLEQDLDASSNSVEDPSGFLRLEKLDPEGEVVWSRQFGSGAVPFDSGYVAADSAGNALVLVSLVRSGVDFGGGGLAGDAVLAKYDADGNYLFGKALPLGGPIVYPTGNPLQADSAGNWLVNSSSFGEIDVGLGSIFCGGDYVIKLDATGTPLWNACAPAGYITVMPDGGYVTSATLGYAQMVGARHCDVAEPNSTGSEGGLARFDAEGHWLATACAMDTGAQFFGNVAPDPAGGFFMTAAFTRQLTLLDGSVVPALDTWWTALIAKVDLEP